MRYIELTKLYRWFNMNEVDKNKDKVIVISNIC